MSQTLERVRNGVDTEQLFGTLDRLAQTPALEAFTFRATNRCLGGAHNRSTIKSFYGAGQEDSTRVQEFTVDAGAGDSRSATTSCACPCPVRPKRPASWSCWRARSASRTSGSPHRARREGTRAAAQDRAQTRRRRRIRGLSTATTTFRRRAHPMTGWAHAGSQRQIQAYVNNSPLTAVLDAAVTAALPTIEGATIEWLSPLAAAGSVECKDGAFWQEIGEPELAAQVVGWWPARGGRVGTRSP